MKIATWNVNSLRVRLPHLHAWHAADQADVIALRELLILGSQGMSEACTGCTINLEPRRQERPSDHTPVLAEFTHG